MIVGGYLLHLYCDTIGCQNQSARRGGEDNVPPGEFTGDNQREAMQHARRAGWSFTTKTESFCYCPVCTKKGVG